MVELVGQYYRGKRMVLSRVRSRISIFTILIRTGSSNTRSIQKHFPNTANSLPGTRVWGMPVSPICWPSSSTRTTTPRCSSNTRITSACRPGMCAVVGRTGSHTCSRGLHSSSPVLALSYEEGGPVAPWDVTCLPNHSGFIPSTSTWTAWMPSRPLVTGQGLERRRQRPRFAFTRVHTERARSH